MSIVEITTNIILPIFIVIGLAGLLDYKFTIDPQPLSRLLVYLFTPALVFNGLAFMEIDAGEAGQLIGGTIGVLIVMAVLAFIVARALHFERSRESAFILGVSMINAGNYGIPLNELAFGNPGEQRAVLCYVASAALVNSLGVFVASRGSASTREALLNTFKVPLLYTAALGIIVNAGNITLPDPLVESMDILGQAAIPGMLTVLGIQLSRTLQNSAIREQITAVTLSAGLRLMISPLIGVSVALLLGLSGVTRQVLIVQVGMPTAVMSGVLAVEFGADAEHVTAAILVSTVASLLTLSGLLFLLM